MWSSYHQDLFNPETILNHIVDSIEPYSANNFFVAKKDHPRSRKCYKNVADKVFYFSSKTFSVSDTIL